MADHDHTLSLATAEATFEKLFDSTISSTKSGHGGLRAYLGLSAGSPSRGLNQERKGEFAKHIRENIDVLFGSDAADTLSKLDDQRLVQRFLGACYRATLPANKASLLDPEQYPPLASNRGKALEALAKVTIEGIVACEGGSFSLGGEMSEGSTPMGYLRAIQLGLRMEQGSDNRFSVISPSVSLPASHDIKLSGRLLAQLSASPERESEVPQNKPLDIAHPAPRGQRKTAQEANAPARPRRPSFILPSDESLFKELSHLTEEFRGGGEPQQWIKDLWGSLKHTLDDDPLEQGRKLGVLEKWYSNERSLGRLLEYLGTSTESTAHFKMDGSRTDPITVRLDSEAKELLYNTLIERELAQRNISITSPDGSPVSFWDLRRYGFELSVDGVPYVNFKGNDGTSQGRPINPGARFTVVRSGSGFELNPNN